MAFSSVIRALTRSIKLRKDGILELPRLVFPVVPCMDNSLVLDLMNNKKFKTSFTKISGIWSISLISCSLSDINFLLFFTSLFLRF